MDHAPEAKFQEPTDHKTRAGLGKFLRPNTPYDNFMEGQGIPIYRDMGVRRVQDLPRKPWKRMGGNGTFIQLLGTEGLWGSYVIEVPGAGALNPEKHLYEEQFLVVEGRGITEVWVDGNPKKLVARNMIAMLKAINAALFPDGNVDIVFAAASIVPDGTKAVTCYTCHRGNHLPPAPLAATR